MAGEDRFNDRVLELVQFREDHQWVRLEDLRLRLRLVVVSTGVVVEVAMFGAEDVTTFTEEAKIADAGRTLPALLWILLYRDVYRAVLVWRRAAATRGWAQGNRALKEAGSSSLRAA